MIIEKKRKYRDYPLIFGGGGYKKKKNLQRRGVFTSDVKQVGGKGHMEGATGRFPTSKK